MDEQTSAWRVFTAPLMVWAPSRAGRAASFCPRWAFIVSFVLWTALPGMVSVFLAICEDMVRYAPPPSPGSGTYYPPYQIEFRSIPDVWRDWHQYNAFGFAESMFFTVWAASFGSILLGAWFFLPNVHRSGSGVFSFLRVLRAVFPAVGLLSLLIAVIGGAAVGINRYDMLPGKNIDEEWYFACVLGGMAGCWWLILWQTRATRSAGGPEVSVELPPTCEGCGYDLTHIPADGRCPECAFSTATSLTPGAWRFGCQWQHRREMEVVSAWFATTVEVLIRPGPFYQELMIRRPADEALTYAKWQFPAIGAAAAPAVFLFVCIVGNPPPEAMCFMPLGALLLIPLLFWGLHRIVAASMTSWCIFRGLLPVSGWMTTIVSYETAYLWVFAAWNGGLAYSFGIWEDWLSGLLGMRRMWWFLRAPPEFLLVAAGNLLLVLIWLWRYDRAMRSVRWSNF